MRNVLISRDAAAQAAGVEVFDAGGNAVDAVVAAMLAGATRGSPAALLGGAWVLVAGAGAGAYAVDGRARAPGVKSERRAPLPAQPPSEWQAAVPGLIDAALAAHNRFGSLGLGPVVRAAVGAVKDTDSSPKVRARLKLLEVLPRAGGAVLDRVGLLQGALEVAGPAAGGVITRADLESHVAPLVPLEAHPAGPFEILAPPADAPVRNPPPDAPVVPVEAAVSADMHGVVACAVWAVPPEAVALPGETGLSLPALCNPPTKGVTRRRPGTAIPLVCPAAVVRREGRAWAGVAAAGEGALGSVRDAWLRARLEAVGGESLPGGSDPVAAGTRAVVLWLVREQGDEVRSVTESFAV